MRIISGQHKGRRLRAPKQLPVRPTTDMAKEALFNILANRYDFEEIEVLDLFSGTGNISYEFCSRGTSAIQAVDKDLHCVKFIQDTADNLDMSIQVINSDVFSFLLKTPNYYDIIFADPPYAIKQLYFEKLISIIFERKLLKPEGDCILEHSKQIKLNHLNNFVDIKTYGGNCFSFFEQKKADL